MGSQLLGQLKKKCYYVNIEDEEEKDQEAIDREQKYKAIDQPVLAKELNLAEQEAVYRNTSSKASEDKKAMLEHSNIMLLNSGKINHLSSRSRQKNDEVVPQIKEQYKSKQ